MNSIALVFVITCFGVAFGQRPFENPLSLIPKGELIESVKKRFKEGSPESYRQAILYLQEIEQRGTVFKDWEEFQVKQALAQCYYVTGRKDTSFVLFSALATQDTSKYFGEKPKSLLSNKDLLYQRAWVYQEIAFNSENRSHKDSLDQFSQIVDSVVAKYPNEPEASHLLFNKSLFLYRSGRKAEAQKEINRIRNQYPEFEFSSRLDSLQTQLHREGFKTKGSSVNVPKRDPGIGGLREGE